MLYCCSFFAQSIVAPSYPIAAELKGILKKAEAKEFY